MIELEATSTHRKEKKDTSKENLLREDVANTKRKKKNLNKLSEVSWAQTSTSKVRHEESYPSFFPCRSLLNIRLPCF